MIEFLCAAAVVVALLWAVWLSLRPKVRGVPSVPGGLPFFGHVLTLGAGSAWDTFAAWVPQFGRVFSVRIFTSEMLCVADPDMLRVILQTKLNSFLKDREWTYKPFLVLLGDGLVTSHGQNWLRQRTVMATHLKVGLLENVPSAAVRAVQRFSKKLDEYNARKEVPEIAAEFRHLTLQVIAELLLSISPEESDETFAHMYLPIVEEGNLRVWQPWRMFLPLPSWFKFRSDVKKLDDYVSSLMTQRRRLRERERQEGQEGEGQEARRVRDVLDILLDAVDRAGTEWTAETERQCRDELKTFVLAGHETSASMLTWALFELSLPEHREMKQRVRDEAEKVFGAIFNPADCTLIRALPRRELLDEGLSFADCCLREALRKYSVVPTVVRVAAEDVHLSDNVFVPKGSTLMVSMQGVHHNPEIWPQPLKYDPSRFLEPVKPYTFLPFIEGPRMCLGQFLSLLESKIVLSLLLLTYDFEVLEPERAKEKHAFMIPIIPKEGHYLRPVRRTQSQ